MKPYCAHYILHRGLGFGTLCSIALSIGVVSARGSSDKIFIAQIRLKCGKFLLDKWATLLNSYDKSLFAGFVSLGKFDK